MRAQQVVVSRMPQLSLYRKFSFGIVVIAGYLMITSGYWDIWWHGAIGRESVWIPPHIGMFISLGVVVLGFFIRLIGDLKSGRRLPKGYVCLILGLALTAVSYVIDDWWHRVYGPEFGNTPLVVWSPPHVLLLGSGTFAAFGFLHALVKETGPMNSRLFAWLTAVQFAVVSSLVTFLLLPFEPMSILRVSGVYGVFFLMFPFVLFRFSAFAVIRRTGVFTFMAVLNWIHLSTMLSIPWGIPRVILPFTIGVLPGILVDVLVYLIGSSLTTGTLAFLSGTYALTFSLVYYPFTNFYRSIGYSIPEITVIVVFATASAILAGCLSPAFSGLLAKQRAM